jgi:hypothetical protein
MEMVTVKEMVEWIKTGTRGRWFSVRFKKRTNGEDRFMLCKYGVKSRLRGGERAYEPNDHNLVWVFDKHKNNYRSIPIEGVYLIKINGVNYGVER